MTPPSLVHVQLSELGEGLSHLRLYTPELGADMERSLVRHGQLTPVLARRETETEGWQVVDGFKRLRSARALGWPQLLAQTWEGDGVNAKLLLWQCNQSHGLTDLEEAWVVRALYREDGLTQARIAQLFGRHKTWVCRRLMLAEGLDDAVQANVRLGLLSSTDAREIGRLPRGNQEATAQFICRRGLTTRQSARLVDELLVAADEAGQRRAFDAAAAGSVDSTPASRPQSRKRTPGEWLVADAASVTRACTRLHARILDRALTSLGTEAAEVAVQALRVLRPALVALDKTIERQLEKVESHVVLDA